MVVVIGDPYKHILSVVSLLVSRSHLCAFFCFYVCGRDWARKSLFSWPSARSAHHPSQPMSFHANVDERGDLSFG